MQTHVYTILGPAGTTSELGEFVSHPVMVRGLIASLIAEQGRMVGTHRLVDALWNNPPNSAEANLRSYITRLRRTLSPENAENLITRRGGGGYGLMIEGHDCDLAVFRRLVSIGRQRLVNDDLHGAASALREAVGLWKGPVGDDLPQTWYLETFATGLNMERWCVIEELATVELKLGDGHTTAARLTALVAAEPTRERAWALLAQAHHLTSGYAVAMRTIHQAGKVLSATIGPADHPYLNEIRESLERLHHNRQEARGTFRHLAGARPGLA